MRERDLDDRHETLAIPPIVDRPTWEAALAELRAREKAALWTPGGLAGLAERVAEVAQGEQVGPVRGVRRVRRVTPVLGR